MSRSTIVLFSVTGIVVVSITISFVAFNTASPTTNNQIPATNTQPPATATFQPSPASTQTPTTTHTPSPTASATHTATVAPPSATMTLTSTIAAFFATQAGSTPIPNAKATTAQGSSQQMNVYNQYITKRWHKIDTGFAGQVSCQKVVRANVRSAKSSGEG